MSDWLSLPSFIPTGAQLGIPESVCESELFSSGLSGSNWCINVVQAYLNLLSVSISRKMD